MGSAAELCATECNIPRQEQDQYAITSYQRAISAQEQGLFEEEIVPVEISGKKGTVLVDRDEEPAGVKFEKLPHLKPVFLEGGTVTATNASIIKDGAAALLLMSSVKDRELGLQPIAKILFFTDSPQPPKCIHTYPHKP